MVESPVIVTLRAKSALNIEHHPAPRKTESLGESKKLQTFLIGPTFKITYNSNKIRQDCSSPRAE